MLFAAKAGGSHSMADIARGLVKLTDDVLTQLEAARLARVPIHAVWNWMHKGYLPFATPDRRALPNNEPTTWHEGARCCLQHGRDVLPEREVGFLTSLCWQLHGGREPSEKQAKWLNDIMRRLKRRG